MKPRDLVSLLSDLEESSDSESEEAIIDWLKDEAQKKSLQIDDLIDQILWDHFLKISQ